MRYPLLIALGAMLALAAPAMAQTVQKPIEKEEPRRLQPEQHIETLDSNSDDENDAAATERRAAENVRQAIEKARQATEKARQAAENARQAADNSRRAIEKAQQALSDSMEAIETTIEWRSDSLEAFADSLADALSDSLDAVADSIENAIGDSLESSLSTSFKDLTDSLVHLRGGDGLSIHVNTADADSLSAQLRAQLRRQMVATREVMGNAHQINKQIHTQMRQMRDIHIITRRDTTGMAKELQSAEQALASARGSIQPLDSDMIFLKQGDARVLAMKLDNSAGNQNRILMMVGKNEDGDHRNSIIINSCEAKGPLSPRGRYATADGMVVIGKDTIKVVDGKDVQTIITTTGDPSGTTTNTIVVVSSREEGQGAHATARITMTTTTTVSHRNSIVSTQSAAKATAPVRENAAGHMLDANYPNPFTGSTTIAFTLPRAEHATLTVYDAHGSLIKTLKDEEMSEGSHSVMFDASGLPSGTYLYRLTAGGFNQTKTMTLEK